MKKIILFTSISISSVFGEIIHPPDGSEINYIHVMFQWEESILRDGYNFELSTTNDFSSPLVDITTIEPYYIEKK